MLTTFSGRVASQNEWELRAFIEFLNERKCRRYLEIGAREGDTFHEVMLSLPPLSSGVACDLPGGPWGKSTTRRKLQMAIESVRLHSRSAYLLIGDSRSPQMIEDVKACGPYDAILIDGDHSYESVKADWDNYSSLAPLVAFHDIVGFGQIERAYGNPVEVPRLWAEIKADHNTVEFIEPHSAMGIGCVLL